jgi:hypothetical protein
LSDHLDGVIEPLLEKEIRAGEKLNVEALLQCKVDEGDKKVAVVACGPVGM